VNQPALVSLPAESVALPAADSGWNGLPELELQRVRASLARRFDDCWDRLDDVVSELVALHGMSRDEIVRRVERMIAVELAEAT
jgi:hypothetical protein